MNPEHFAVWIMFSCTIYVWNMSQFGLCLVYHICMYGERRCFGHVLVYHICMAHVAVWVMSSCNIYVWPMSRVPYMYVWRTSLFGSCPHVPYMYGPCRCLGHVLVCHICMAHVGVLVMSSCTIYVWRISQFGSCPCVPYHEWPHRQGGCLASWRLQGCKIESRLSLSCADLYCSRGAQGVLPMRVGGAMRQLDLPPQTPLPVAGCGRLQLGVSHWATSVDYCK